MTMLSHPQILKAHRLLGKNLVFRDAKESDAGFILSLRTDSQKARHLSQTPSELSAQIAWLQAYAERTDQAYFIIESKDGTPFGTIRLYDAQGDSFCWGSWILKNGVPQSAAIESALMVYSFAMDHLEFRAAHFDVRKGNESVWRFHERFGALRVGETADDYLYKIGLEEVSSTRLRYRKYLPEGVGVEW